MKTYDFKTFSQMTLDLIFKGMNRMPSPGEEVFSQEFMMQLGGGPTVIPIVLNSLGKKTARGTFWGEDEESKLCVHLMKSLGFTNYTNFYSTIERGKGKNPLVVSCVFSWDRDRGFVTRNDEVCEESLPEETVYQYLKDAKVVFAPKGHFEVTKRLHEEGSIIVSDTGWKDDLNIKDFVKMLSFVDVFTPNDKEAMKMTETTSVEEALKVLGQYTRLPIVTMGSRGCAWMENNTLRFSEAISFPKSIDTTGAGDNFLAGVIYGILTSDKISNWLKLGNIFAGYSTTGLGCYQSMVTGDIIRQYYPGKL